MAKETTLPMSAAPVSRTAASLSFAGAVTFVILLVTLHVIKPELDPSWHFISEYAIGDFGWIMALAFFSLALSFIALFVALRSQIRSLGGRIGMVLLLVGAAGLTMGGAFTTDPILSGADKATLNGMLHNFGGTLSIVIPFAILLISWSLARNPAWLPARRSILPAAGLAVVGFLVAFMSLAWMMSQSGGSFGPDVLVGWPNRLEMLGYCAWLMIVAGGALQLKRQDRSA